MYSLNMWVSKYGCRILETPFRLNHATINLKKQTIPESLQVNYIKQSCTFLLHTCMAPFPQARTLWPQICFGRVCYGVTITYLSTCMQTFASLTILV